MDMVVPLKEIGKVGKRLLVQIAGICQNYKKEMIVEEIDFDTCPVECPFQRFDAEQKRDICMNHCPHKCQAKSPKVVYMNERHKYNIKMVDKIEDSRLSKYQLLQLITYHFLGVDSRGVVPFVSTKQLAKRLGCSKRTIKNNNQRLAKLELIAVSFYGKDLFSVDILGYEKYHLPKMEGGTGYVQMTKGFLEAIGEMDNVNSMRLAIRALLKFDDEVEVRRQEECMYTYNDMKRFMPSNINHKKIIDELMAKTAGIFDIQAYDAFVMIKLKDAYNGKVQKQLKEEEFKETIAHHLQESNQSLVQDGLEVLIDLSSEEIEDLSHLSMEYGVELVIKGLNACVSYIQDEKTPDLIENIGGFIRTVIKNNFIRTLGKNAA